MVNFPVSLDTSTQLPQPSAGVFTNNPSHASLHDGESQAIIALETKLGIGVSTPAASKVLRGTGVGTSTFGSLVLTTDVTGTLPVANGGTGATVATGTGNAVLATSPTIVTPTLTSPAMTTPALGTPTSGVMTNVTGLPYSGLLSTIFSSQVTSYTNGSTTGFYVNLGGIKLVWAQVSVTITAINTPTAWTVTFPSGFFATVSQAQQSLFGGNSNSATGNGTYESLSATAVNGFIGNSSATGSRTVVILAVGT